MNEAKVEMIYFAMQDARACGTQAVFCHRARPSRRFHPPALGPPATMRVSSLLNHLDTLVQGSPNGAALYSCRAVAAHAGSNTSVAGSAVT